MIVFILLGQVFEEITKGRASSAIKKLIGQQPKQATVLRDGAQISLSIEDIVGDFIVIKPSEKIAVDGVVIRGSSTVDEALVTGESLPVTKSVGDSVIGATINKTGSFGRSNIGIFYSNHAHFGNPDLQCLVWAARLKSDHCFAFCGCSTRVIVFV